MSADVAAVKQVVEVLDPLTRDERERVLAFVVSHYRTPPGRKPEAPATREAAEPPSEPPAMH